MNDLEGSNFKAMPISIFLTPTPDLEVTSVTAPSSGLGGQQVTITRLMRGEAVSGSEIALCFACTALAAVLVYFITARIYRGERLAIST